MGAYLSQPVTSKEVFEGSSACITYGGGSMQGWRRTMEDAHIAEVGLGPADADCAIFGVFDGHGGAEVAKFCQKYMAAEIQKLGRFSEGAIEDSLVEVFHRMDDMLRDHHYADELEQLKTKDDLDDEEGRAEGGEGDGAVSMDAIEMLKRVFQIKRWQGEGSPGGLGEEPDSMAMDGEPGAGAAAGGAAAGGGAGAPTAANGDPQQPAATAAAAAPSRVGAAADGDAAAPAAAAAAAAAPASSSSSSSSSGAGPSQPAAEAAAPPAAPRPLLEPAERVQAGCTAVVAVKFGNELYVANAGDSRGVLCRSGKAVALSEDHKPAHETERTRILNAGGACGAVCVCACLCMCVLVVAWAVMHTPVSRCARVTPSSPTTPTRAAWLAAARGPPPPPRGPLARSCRRRLPV
jgi:protein phosphatase 1G